MNVLTLLNSQLMGQTTLIGASATKWRPMSTAGGPQGFIDSGDDVGDRHRRCLAGEKIPSTRATNALDKLSKLRLPLRLEKLLKIRQLNSMSFRNFRQRDWPLFTVFSEFNHRHHDPSS